MEGTRVRIALKSLDSETACEVLEVELFVAVAGGLELHLRRSDAHPAGPGMGHERALQFFGSVTEAIVPDQERRRRPLPL